MLRKALIWATVSLAALVPFALAAGSPLLAWREPVYVVAGFAGVAAMALLMIQPLLAAGLLPGLEGLRGRLVHRWVGCVLLIAVLLHVAGLWITSPPDVIDALLFRSPTPFSAWGVIAMWAMFAAAALALGRRPLGLRGRGWRLAHTGLAGIVVSGTALHALLIDGTMERGSKIALAALMLVAAGFVILRLWRYLLRRRRV